MALMERVATLVRANLNDLIDKAEDPEKMMKQVILDMQNQLMQVKTQVAIAIADQHLLIKKQKEHNENAEGGCGRRSWRWKRRTTWPGGARTVDVMPDDGGEFRQQVADQRAQVENLKSALRKLERKLGEAQASARIF